MVFDATTRAFNLSESTDDRSSHACTSATPLPALPGTATRPAKRRRTTQAGTVSSTPTSSPAPTPILDLDALDAARRRAAGRVMSLWESLAEKYARPIEEDDEIDILTGKICRDRGVLRSVSERGWKIGSFGEALEVEPLVMISEGETETGASEADDEGEAEAEEDTEGEGADDAEAGGEDPLGDWSYDWQYRALPPPRPELSPQDAEDLREFLAAETAIQENRRKSGTQLEPEDDEVVYLGDSLHNIDGTLRDDETSDDEFASMAMTDNSTIRYMKHEDEDDDEADDIEPMASILGALALGKTPTKRTLHPSGPRPKDEEMDDRCAPSSRLSRNTTLDWSDSDCGPQANTGRPTRTSSAIDISGQDMDDDVIVIDSDSDNEPESTNNSGLKPGATSSPLSKRVAPARHASSGVLQSNSSPMSITPSHSPSTQSARTPKASLVGESSLIKPSPAQKNSSNRKHAPPLLPGSPTPNTATTTKKSTSKRVLGALTSKHQTSGSRAVPTSSNLHSGVLDPYSLATTAFTSTKKASNQTSETDSLVESPSKQVHQNEVSVKKTKRKPTSVAASRDKPTLGQAATASLDSPPKVDVPSPKMPTSASIVSLSIRSNSPVKRRKKATVVEVVLPVLRKVPKVKRESTAPHPPEASKHTALTIAATVPNGRSSSQPGGSAPSSERLNPIPETTHSMPHTSLVPGLGVESGLKRKRSIDGAGLIESAVKALGSRTNAGSVGLGPGPLHVCCPPTPLERNRPAVCCPAHSQYHSGLNLHAHPQSAHTSCSTHPHLGAPVYQHQHQHQHLHTHLPYPLPQLPFTANELTEAAYKLIHGLSTFHQVSGANDSTGAGFWLPGAQLPFGFAIPGQAGPSSQALSPKLEEPSIQEKIPSECIPSSQEHERKAEAMHIAADEKPNQIIPALSQPEDPAPVTPDSSFEIHTKKKPITTSVATLSRPSNSKMPPPEREMSVIDIESDSDDELAVCDAGAGSMRWEPPVKKEVNSGVEEGPRKQSSPRKSSVGGRALSRTSPIKLKRIP
ncbi:centromere protein Scm3 [Rhizoctonia solani 123E]|uniref:Centromere protein Scm3 n=1 Tax=Rhizoctonia solani 123E TaxID=1423351 RepID=A0A074S975_9AGAM|nr:centromere protein Scm3 [Rhizoctonia solani 123E]